MGVSVGSEVGPFIIQRPLVSGAFSDAYLARSAAEENGTPEPVFLKVLREAMAANPQHVDRFRREVSLLQSLNSVYFPQFVAEGEIEGRPWLALEFVPGHQIHQIVSSWERRHPDLGSSLRAPFSYREYVRIAQDSLRALRDLDEARIVHRDLHAGNIMVRSRWARQGSKPRVAIVDLGLARGENVVTLTGTGDNVGHVFFTAPEQRHRGRHATSKSDIYAWASTMSYALTGLEGLPNSPASRLIEWGVPTDWAALLEAALREDPEERPDLNELLERIDASVRVRPQVGGRRGRKSTTVVAVHDREAQDWWVTNNGFLIRRLTFDPVIFGDDIYRGAYLTPSHSCWDSDDPRVQITIGRAGVPVGEGLGHSRFRQVDLEWLNQDPAGQDPGESPEACPRCLSPVQSVWIQESAGPVHRGWRCGDMSCRLEDDLELFFGSLGRLQDVRRWRQEGHDIVSQVKNQWPDFESVLIAMRRGPTGVLALDDLRSPIMELDRWDQVSIMDGLACDEVWRSRPSCAAVGPPTSSRRSSRYDIPTLGQAALAVCEVHSFAWNGVPGSESDAVQVLKSRMPRFESLYEAWFG